MVLPAEACEFPRLPTELSSWESLTLSGSGKVNRALTLLAGKFAKEGITSARVLEGFKARSAAVRYYKKEAFQHHPQDFYRLPESIPAVCQSTPHSLSRGEVVDLTFRSRFVPSNAAFAAQSERHTENAQVYAKYWRHPKGESTGTVVAVHGWLFGDSRLSALTLIPGFFYRLGLDVVLYELPYHGRRAAKGAERGPMFPSADVALTNEGFAQAVYDLRSIALWLRAQNDAPIGVMGMSLGAYTAALWASLDPLDFVICAAPLVSLADFVWTLLSAEQEQLAALQRVEKHLSLSSLREIFAVHCPLSYQPKTAYGNRLIIAGNADTVIPESQPLALWEHWQRPRLEWFGGDHLTQIIQPATMSAVHSFLTGLGVCHKEPLEIR